MPTEFSAGRVGKIYRFIDTHRDEYSVKMMCRVLEVTRAGFYAWCKQPLSNRSLEDTRLLRLIRASIGASHGIYGAPRVFLDLREAGETWSKHRVARLRVAEVVKLDVQIKNGKVEAYGSRISVSFKYESKS